MKRLIVIATALFLMACHVQQGGTTDVSSTSNINGEVTTNALHLSDYAIRAALGNNPDTAAYVTIRNDGDKTEHLISASCTCATSASLHTMTMNGTMMVMTEQTGGFDIVPHESLVFRPGGNHIMLEGLTTRPKDGDTQPVTLTFATAGKVVVQMPVSNTPLSQP